MEVWEEELEISTVLEISGAGLATRSAGDSVALPAAADVRV